jgi:phosphomannomutase
VPLIKSISGIRGTIGDKPGENLTPADIVRFTAAFATLLIEKQGKKASSHKKMASPQKAKMVIGRDGRTAVKWSVALWPIHSLKWVLM